MGRQCFYRQKIVTQARSVEAKTLGSYLVGEIRSRRELAPEEAALVAEDALEYLTHLVDRGPGQIDFPAARAWTPSGGAPGGTSLKRWSP